MTWKCIAVAAAIASSVAAAALAGGVPETVIGFNGVDADSSMQLCGNGVPCPGIHVEAGYQVATGLTGEYWILGSNWPTFNDGSLDNGTSFAYGQNGHSFDVTTADGRAFNLFAFDAGEAYGDAGGVLTVTGYYAGGGTITETVDVQSHIWTSFRMSSRWVGLSSVRFSQTPGGVYGFSNFLGLDNIAVGRIVELGPLVVPDANTDGVKDIAVVRADPIRTEIRSGASGSLLGTIEFLDPGMIAVDARALPDSDGNGVAEIAVLAVRRSDGRGVVEMRNVTGAQAMRQVWFAAGHRPVALAVIEGDADGNGVAELAVLSTRNSDGRGLVEVKNVYGATNPAAIWMGAGLTPKDLEVVDDADQNGVPEVAVLSSRNSDGRVVVEVKNAAGPTNPNSVWFMAGHTPIDLAVVPDKDGNSIPEVAVLSSRDSDGRVVVEVKNADGATGPSSVWFMAGQTALAVKSVGDADANGVPDIAVLSSRASDGRVLVEVKNAAGATNGRALWYPAGYAARDVAILPDLDGNGVAEAGVLLLRDSDGRIVVQRRNTAGTQAPVDYWFSP
jgi:hypothetical protein